MKRIPAILLLALLVVVLLIATGSGTANADTIASFEAETMTFSPTTAGQVASDPQASGGSWLDLWNPATATKTGVSLPSNADHVTVRASKYCSNNNPSLTVKLNGTSVGTIGVTSLNVLADYTLTITPTSGTKRVDLVWANDNNKGCDQNVFIDKVTFTGPTPPPPPAGPSLGVFAGQDGGDGGAWETSTMTALHAFENTIGATTAAQKPKMAHMFAPFYLDGACPSMYPGPGTAIRESYAPLFTLEFENYGTGSPPAFTYANINNGTFDACFHSYANAMKTLGGNVYLRMFHEMNGNWYSWQVAGHEQEHIAAWRHIHDLLAADGASNVKMVWCPNTRYTGDAGAYANYYPGDAYVDYVCLDGYNWASANGSPWQSFDQIYASSYAEITALSAKPLMVGEYASTEGTAGQKAQWIADAEAVIKTNYPRIRILNWFNQVDGAAQWPVNSSTSSLSAYQTYDNDGYYQTTFP